MEDLKERLQKAEQTSEEYRKQLHVLQVRLDESQKNQARLEEGFHERDEKIEELESEKKESLRQKRELEVIYETERVASMKEMEEAKAREEEFHGIIKHLKETTPQRDLRGGLEDEPRPIMSSRPSSLRSTPSPSLENGHFAPSASLQRSDSRASSKLVLQKDKVIESLRLELAEAQIKLVELENMGGGHTQELERSLLEAKVTNARLIEDNESFQLLLSERTLNGDFVASNLFRPSSALSGRPLSEAAPGSSLAEELETFAGEESESQRRLEVEISSLKDHNKALTLYVSSIIERLLQHDDLESILDKTPNLMAGPGAASARFANANTEKELPPPPPVKDSAAPSFLQRARSVIAPGNTRPRPRPTSQVPASSTTIPTISTLAPEATQFPLSRSSSTLPPNGSLHHRRVNSEWTPAIAVNTIASNAHHSGPPLVSGQISPRPNSYFAPLPITVHPNATARIPSGSSIPTISEHREHDNVSVHKEYNGPPSSNSNSNRDSRGDSSVSSAGDRTSVSSGGSASNTSDLDAFAESPPRSLASANERPGGAVFMGSKMRPLRLVQETAEADEVARKRANRGSWMGWFNKGKAEEGVNVGG
ncbi:hypothetical protein LTR04_005754 [Oleoguttula sp. CCFEE 6159]|nr:hypothetical protein LTR04_005754 [Oleoguttula sp. CCFEE 6159]